MADKDDAKGALPPEGMVIGPDGELIPNSEIIPGRDYLWPDGKTRRRTTAGWGSEAITARNAARAGIGRNILANREQILEEAPKVQDAIRDLISQYDRRGINDPDTEALVGHAEKLSEGITSFVTQINKDQSETTASRASADLGQRLYNFAQKFERTKTGNLALNTLAGLIILGLATWFSGKTVDPNLATIILGVGLYQNVGKNIASAIVGFFNPGGGRG